MKCPFCTNGTIPARFARCNSCRAFEDPIFPGSKSVERAPGYFNGYPSVDAFHMALERKNTPPNK